VSETRNILIESMRNRLAEYRADGIDPYPHRFRTDATTGDIRARYESLPAEAFEAIDQRFVTAGRIVAHRSFGKAIFCHIQDRAGRLQIYLRRDILGDEAFALARRLEMGDIVGVEGRPFKTRTGELTLEARSATLLTKALRPLPEKWHGLRDVETRYRRRYVDLIVNPAVRETFRTRRRIISGIREFLDAHDVADVEQLVECILALIDSVAAHIHLQPLAALHQVEETGLAHAPHGLNAPGDADLRFRRC
jgi:lysyl-tRNA synthetase class 2